MLSQSLSLPLALLSASALFPSLASGHIALWNPGLYGFNGTDNSVAQYNTAAAVGPLRKYDNLTQSEWFGHGFLDLPPKDGDFMELTPGKTETFELSCNRAFTSYRSPTDTGDLPEYACTGEGPLHTVNNFNDTTPVNTTLLGGCVLAIAYESDVTKLRPEFFSVFSVNHTCVWTREIDFQVPKDMPACPEGGCHCSWNWIHTSGNYNAEGRGEGYGDEMYHNMYRCRINNATNTTAVVDTPKVAAKCEGDTSSCTPGAKQPHYWSQLDGNNNNSTIPPLYNMIYGWADGAQNDIFVTSTKSKSDDSSAARSMPALSAKNIFLMATAILASIVTIKS
ncbi:hypothetical protein [Phaffia rhodozyma]|uniref:Uncharacterized protein n=1 Tax=Phaffia rhodozyma TaxID=264483 RepID=A0A0F7SP43_PHARH|nr:hypothetical protein [Phaffia rhodozyma]